MGCGQHFPQGQAESHCLTSGHHGVAGAIMSPPPQAGRSWHWGSLATGSSPRIAGAVGRWAKATEKGLFPVPVGRGTGKGCSQ